MEKGDFKIVKQEKNELIRPFPLLQDLFTFAQEQGISTDGFSDQNEIKGKAVPLPEKFIPLVATFPGTYFVVAYDDRRSSYYREGTRHQLIRLSTVEHRGATDARTREMDIRLGSNHRADRIEIRAREAVRDQSFKNINEATGEEIEQPHGDARYTYEIDENGTTYKKKLEYNRLDEGLFTLGGEAKPVRWVRNLTIDHKEEGSNEIEYSDLYIVGRNTTSTRDQRAGVKTTILGSIDSPESIIVQVGSGHVESSKLLFEDKNRKVKFILHRHGQREQPLDILKDDPVYAELLGESPDTEHFIELLRSRCLMLQEDWDKPQSVYSDNKKITEKPKQISS